MGSPSSTPTLEAIAELIAVVARLREPRTGCPWDLEQTHASLVPYLLEEAHEVADAIRHGDDNHLAEELGDLLLQVVLHGQIAGEAGRFDLAAIARGISAKLVRRHPHVFGGAEAADSTAVKEMWEAIKVQERAEREGASTNSASPLVSPLSDRLAGKVRGQGAIGGLAPWHFPLPFSPPRRHDHLQTGGRGRLRVG
jgi:XTP/dITP diphosphohydrolase